jgi:hypothetical protein
MGCDTDVDWPPEPKEKAHVPEYGVGIAKPVLAAAVRGHVTRVEEAWHVPLGLMAMPTTFPGPAGRWTGGTRGTGRTARRCFIRSARQPGPRPGRTHGPGTPASRQDRNRPGDTGGTGGTGRTGGTGGTGRLSTAAAMESVAASATGTTK